jgi:hypothetical protein
MFRMRTIPQAVQYFKERDPETAVTEWWLRSQLHNNVIPCHRAGKRILVDLDRLEAYLANPPTITETIRFEPIRRIITK